MVKSGAEGNPQLMMIEAHFKLEASVKAAVERLENGQRSFAERLTKIEKQLGIGSERAR